MLHKIFNSLLIAVLLVGVVFGAEWLLGAEGPYSFPAGIFFAEKISPDVIRSEYANSTLKVLVVPGHEQFTGGTQYKAFDKDITERDLVLQLGKYLQEELSHDTHLYSQLVRDGGGDFADWFKAYMAENNIDVQVFRQKSHDLTDQGIAAGTFIADQKVNHNEAPTPTALVLYGINKYANEHEVNLVLHLHINDYPRRPLSKPGKYTGFAVYVPEAQLPNTRSSKAIGDSITRELAFVEPASNYKREQPSLVEDQELIAIGSNGSRDGASILVEYGYIYEKKFTDPKLRDQALRDLAHATYLGIENYFNQKVALSTK